MTKKVDVGSILSKAATRADAKPSKSKTPSVSLPQHAQTIETWLKADTDLKDAMARKASAEDVFLRDVEGQRLAESRRDGKYYSSVKVDNKIVVSVQNRYSPIQTADYPAFDEVFGARTKDFFKTKTEISLTDAALTDETILQKLIAAVGEEKFGLYFDVTQFVAPTELFHETRTVNAEVGNQADQLIQQGLLRPYKSAVKLA